MKGGFVLRIRHGASELLTCGLVSTPSRTLQNMYQAELLVQQREEKKKKIISSMSI